MIVPTTPLLPLLRPPSRLPHLWNGTWTERTSISHLKALLHPPLYPVSLQMTTGTTLSSLSNNANSCLICISPSAFNSSVSYHLAAALLGLADMKTSAFVSFQIMHKNELIWMDCLAIKNIICLTNRMRRDSFE